MSGNKRDLSNDGPGNAGTYEVGSFQVGWPDPGPVHRVSAIVWNDPGEGPAITADAPLKVTEGAAGSKFVFTLNSASTEKVTFNLSGPPSVTFSTASASVTIGQMISEPVTVTANHDRNVTSDRAVITATAASADDNWAGKTHTVPVLAVDDDYTMSVVIKDRGDDNRFYGVTEKSPFDDGAAVARWVTIRITAPEGGMPNIEPIVLTGSSATGDFAFSDPTWLIYESSPDPYLSTADVVPTTTPAVYDFLPAGATEADVWLIANDDLEDEEAAFIQIGAEPTGEEGRIEPRMIRIDDADPDVTLSIDDVSEGADGVTMTVTATAAGAMPGIFEIPAIAGSW
ncbi:hypothetical protein [Candidatus Palauibacter sp.]|uniref:hypothetical protein n=1 Tax=Candidatus Palauibacter sp. TaxID=3101350 RepID=UPI003AF2CD72